MNLIDRLFILSKIYASDSYYDDQGRYLHRIPVSISEDDLIELKKDGYSPNDLLYAEHDEVIKKLKLLASEWTIKDAAGAFIAGLWSEPFIYQSALTGKLIAGVMPDHAYEPYSENSDTCKVCGLKEAKEGVDRTLEWYFRFTSGVPLDGNPLGHLLAFEEMNKLKKNIRPVPNEYDIWIFRAVMTVIKELPAKTRYSKLRDTLAKEKLLPVSNKSGYDSLLEALAIIGILDTEEYPGMATKYTSYITRDMRPNVRVEVQAPLAWWDSSVGINENNLKKIFGEYDCSKVNLKNRPEPIIPRDETIAGLLEKKKSRAPRKKQLKSPDAGTGIAEAGDVYAVCIREVFWVSVYCHRVEDNRAVVEFLAGTYDHMPMKDELVLSFQPRLCGERWQAKTSGIDKTPGIKRIVRNVPVPKSKIEEPDGIPYAQAKELSHLAGWCFENI